MILLRCPAPLALANKTSRRLRRSLHICCANGSPELAYMYCGISLILAGVRGEDTGLRLAIACRGEGDFTRDWLELEYDLKRLRPKGRNAFHCFAVRVVLKNKGFLPNFIRDFLIILKPTQSVLRALCQSAHKQSRSLCAACYAR